MKTIVIFSGSDQFNILSSTVSEKSMKKDCNTFSLIEEAFHFDECFVDWDVLLYRKNVSTFENNSSHVNNSYDWFIKGSSSMKEPIKVFSHDIECISKAFLCGRKIYGLNRKEGNVYLVKLDDLNSSLLSTDKKVKFDSAVEPNIIDISSSGKECFAIDSESGIYKVPNLLWRLEGTTFCNIFSGFGFCLLLTDTGAVYSFGNGSRGELGQRVPNINMNVNNSNDPHSSIPESKSTNIIEKDKEKEYTLSSSSCNFSKPNRLEFFDDLPSIVVSLACGGWHSLALTSDGDCYSWGWNESGQLGHSFDKLSSVSTDPFPVDLGSSEDPIVEIAAGSRHSFAVLKSGNVFSWGFNKFGQLGLGDNENKNLPSLVNIPPYLIAHHTSCDTKSKPKVHVQCGRWITLLQYSYT